MSARNVASIEAVFAPDGPLAAKLAGFEARAGQVQMSQLIERGFLESAHTIAEAGTGVGKSLAYLVPALRSGKKVVVSTATIALQEQLVRKDIPLVVGALGIPARVQLLKGRGHYLCRAKLDRMRTERLIASSGTMEAMWEWADGTATGDRAELPFAPPPLEWESLDADADDCVGEFCDRFRDCWFFKHRDAAKYADVVVVNHALFFLDLAMGGTLLPPYDFAILDEAHQCEAWASAALTATLSASGVNRLMRRVHRTYHLPASYDAEIDEAMRGLVQTLARVPGERYPLAANESALEALGADHEARVVVLRELASRAQASAGKRRGSGAAARPRDARRARAHRDRRSHDAAGRRGDLVGGADRRREPLRGELGALRCGRVSAHGALSPNAERRAHERDDRDRNVVRVSAPRARRRRRARVRRAVALRLRRAGAALSHCGTRGRGAAAR